MPKIRDIENVLAKNYDNWLLTMQESGWQSVKVSLYRAVKNLATTVYGRESGEEGNQKVGVIDCLLVGDDFFPADAASSGTFQEGWMFTVSTLPNVGDLVELERESSHGVRRYNITDIHKIGTSKGVFRKFKLSAIGD